jgi:hypothetical protein
LLDIVTYSYLIFPLLFLLLKAKFKEVFILLLAIYGLSFFSLIFFDVEIPKNIKKYYQGFYTFFEYSFFTCFIWMNIRSVNFKRFIALISLAFIIFQFYYIANISVPQKLDSIPIGIETILVFIYVFYFFFEFSKSSKDVFIYNHYNFWISVGILIYLGGSFFFYILVNHLNKSEYAAYANVAYVAEIIKNILFAFSAFIYKKFPVNKIHNHPKNIPNLDMI